MTVADVTAAPTRSRADHRHARRESLWYAASIIGFLLLWYVVSWATNVANPGLVPTPVEVFTTFGHLLVHPFGGHILPVHVLYSLSRWGLGFGVAVVAGIPLGLLLGAVPVVRAMVAPLFEYLRYIPPFAWIPLAVLWLGSGVSSSALVVFVAAFPAVVISTQVGAALVDPSLLRASRNLGAGGLRRLVGVITPLSLPGAFAGVRVAASNGWMALIAAELIGGRAGVGFLISQGQSNGDLDVVMAGMVAIALTAALLDSIVITVSKRMTRWRRSVAL